MIEVALVFDDTGKTLHWHEPAGSSAASIPDTRDLWEILWDGRGTIAGVAHTHPHYGTPHPSHTDLTTWKAVELGLGVRMLWPIVSFDQVINCLQVQPGIYDNIISDIELEDIHELRIKSGMNNEQRNSSTA